MDNKKTAAFFEKKGAVAAVAVAILVVLFIAVFAITTLIVNSGKSPETTTQGEGTGESQSGDAQREEWDYTLPAGEKTTVQQTTEATTARETTTAGSSSSIYASAQIVPFPSDTASWQMLCLNKEYRVDASAEDAISLSYVAGSSERMDQRAAAAYENMYEAAAAEGIYLTPCSGYRSYSTQKRLYYEFVNEYIADGYSRAQAEELASRRRMPPGSSEHNIGICMDIITASSAYNFQNTRAYAWLTANAADYGFILRYPEDKVDVTGVKFEPWHWRFVGVENASAIAASGLCLEEYLGIA